MGEAGTWALCVVKGESAERKDTDTGLLVGVVRGGSWLLFPHGIGGEAGDTAGKLEGAGESLKKPTREKRKLTLEI